MIEYGAIHVMTEKGPYTGKPRPVIVVQNPTVDIASVLIVPLTSWENDTPDIRVRVEPDPRNGLLKPSFAMCDKLSAIAMVNLGKQIGVATSDQMKDIKHILFYLLDGAR